MPTILSKFKNGRMIFAKCGGDGCCSSLRFRARHRVLEEKNLWRISGFGRRDRHQCAYIAPGQSGAERAFLAKGPNDTDRRKEVYSLTEKGLTLIPILMEMSGWSAQYDPKTTTPQQFVAAVYADRDAMYSAIQDAVREGGSLFGEGALVAEQDVMPCAAAS